MSTEHTGKDRSDATENAILSIEEDAANMTAERMVALMREFRIANDLLAAECKNSIEFLESAKTTKKEMVETFRGMRMTTTTEVAAMLKPLEDLRKFFLGAEHDKEIARLREFVDLCERLEKLKASGFLDTVADTMLKLS